ncbi:SET and MYND domain-containing protein 4-like [Ochlerotatus camptorhynchus]|uniref:SET and MYND domain-containing protein 4-like n=1 Tax=Ochlerotatus camptorhynchus TaxID=644619 RepID=UPI0031DA4CFE
MEREGIYKYYTEGFPNERSEEARHKRILDSIKRAMPVKMSSELEQTLMQTIENPNILLTNDVQVYRDHIQQNGHCFDQPDLPKCSARAAKHRCDGNLLYAKKEYGNALKKYNESICSAPNDSEELGMGYANRSAIFYNMEDHVLALANITLAKNHNYPERLMPKLLVREANCKQAIDKHNHNRKALGSNLNLFLSDRICVRKLPIYGNSLMARQDFKAGDVILQEKPLMVAVSEQLIFIRCNHCMSGNLLHLIPCPNCVSAMFCNENCLQDGQTMHRFECDITGELSKLKDTCVASRMFFHGLALFDDDVNKMMAFCRTVKTTENTFLDIDYSNYDPLKEFEIFLADKPGENSLLDYSMRLNAAIVHALLLNVSSVRALITNRAQEDFMLQCFVEYLQKVVSMSIQRSQHTGFVSVLYPMASLCNHSCDPNTLALDNGGQLKLITLRPIRRGGHIFISYGAHYQHGATERQLELSALGFNCICDVCDEQKHQKLLAKARHSIAIAPKDWATIKQLMTDTGFNNADRKNALQQFVQRYASIHPRKDFASILQMYCFYLTGTYSHEMGAAMRAKIAG